MSNEKPPCFGKLWDGTSPECKGGVDPAFKDEETGSNLRQKCEFFESCGVRYQASRMESARALIDPKSLVKGPPTLTPSRPAQQQQGMVPAFVERFAQSFMQQQAQQPQMVMVPPQQMMKPAQHPQQMMMMPAPQMAYGYQQMMPVNYQMPGYLTVPEHREPGGSFFGFAMRTIFRSMGKSVGHSVAHLFDSNPLGPYPPQGNGGGPSNGG